MNNLSEYKGYYGSVGYSAEDRCFHGKLEFISDLVTFEAATVSDLEREFRAATDDYLETCREVGKEPQKTFKGLFNVRISPELHRKAAIIAMKKKVSLNKFIEMAIGHEIEAVGAGISNI
jgi:predicted HicB family RNase H-like nuclease